MGLTVKDTSGPALEPIPEGTHLARIEKIIDLGTHFSDFAKKDQHQVLIVYNLVNEDRRISKTYTLSMNEKANLRKHLEGVIGRSFTAKELADGIPLEKFAGKQAMVSIVHADRNGKTYGNINGVVAVPKGMPPAKEVETTVYVMDETPDAVLESLPEWMQDKIMGSKEWTVRKPAGDPSEASFGRETEAPADDEIPF